MRRTFTLFSCLGLMATLLLCADASGKWKGSFDGGGETRNVVFDLKTASNGLTGTVGGLNPSALEIKDGKVEGDKISFWFMVEYQGSPIKLVCKGQLAGDEIHFNIGLDDGSWGTDFVAKKSS